MLQRIRNKRQGQKGFTLIELMIVIAIIGILAAIAIPNFLSYRQRAYDSAAQSDLKNLMTAQEAYFVDHDTYVDITGVSAGGEISDLDLTLSKGVTAGGTGSTTGYTMSAYHTSGSGTWTVEMQSDSEGGKMELIPK